MIRTHERQLRGKSAVSTIASQGRAPLRAGRAMTWKMRQLCRRVRLPLTLSAAAIVLCSCVESEVPLLVGSEPILGKQFHAQLFRDFSNDAAHQLRKTTFRWQGTEYVNVEPGAVNVAKFSTQTLDGNDSLIQTSDASGKAYKYWIGRKFMGGAFAIFPIDETDADSSLKDKACTNQASQDICVVRSSEQLFALARATAAKPIKRGELAVIVEQGLEARSDAHPASFEHRP